MAVESTLLSNGNVVIALAADSASAAPVRWVQEFLHPQFRVCAETAAHFTLLLHPFARWPREWSERASQTVTIRSSSAKSFNLVGRAGDLEDGSRIVVDDDSRTAYRFDGSDDRVEIYWSESSRIHLFELTRYTALLVEEASATALLHASAASDNHGCHLAVGAKGAGKTTLLFHLVQDHGLRHFSGDKVLLSMAAGSARVRGWPDYPHIGIGTFSRFPGLARACGVSLVDDHGAPRPASEKELVDPARLRAAVRLDDGAPAPVRTILFPRVGRGNPRCRVLPDAEKTSDRLLPFLEHPHEFAAVGWHALLRRQRCTERRNQTQLLAALRSATWIEIEGEIAVPPALLKEPGLPC
jgi:hypothetical protein